MFKGTHVKKKCLKPEMETMTGPKHLLVRWPGSWVTAETAKHRQEEKA